MLELCLGGRLTSSFKASRILTVTAHNIHSVPTWPNKGLNKLYRLSQKFSLKKSESVLLPYLCYSTVSVINTSGCSVLRQYEVRIKREVGHSSSVHTHGITVDTNEKKKQIQMGPGLEHFIANNKQSNNTLDGDQRKVLSRRDLEKISHPYVNVADIDGNGRKVYFDVYGCQMNVSDTEVAWSILKNHGYVRTNERDKADVVLVMTCSIREGAEQKVWNKLDHLRGLKNKRAMNKKTTPMKIGVLGCMAERLKKKLIEKEKSIDVVAGPDSYRDLPRLLSLADGGEATVNVLLSLEETYADVVPVSLSANRMSAFVSIMRGCDNMCTYCIVPFTRGRERSRNVDSIVEEVRYLSNQGIKEITLLGQNVNSYRDVSQIQHAGFSIDKDEKTHVVKGFKTIYKPKKGGLRFADLLDKVSQIDPEMRIRFTSPHPKDFPDEVLHLVKEKDNICKNIHLPAQCGSTRILELMRRGYTREAYCELVIHIRSIIPDVSLSSDFICGFCSETEEEFQETLSLIQQVKYNFCFLFPYSLREKTPAHRKLVDDVPHSVKLDRLQRMCGLFRTEVAKINRMQVGQQQLILVEGASKRSNLDLVGRNDGNTRVIFPDVEVEDKDIRCTRKIQPGDYVSVLITNSSTQVLKGIPLAITTLQAYHD
ncbi:CDK5RAP1-like protein [Homarus americanus]|uniref:CDK5RAP1-like protein n=1 Tax=Homarus americanus TaxID=6706 RepID=A0A8J5N1E2_HOMAM|nr:CDK5RAP1-like protein [Homarus americanus]KAG7171201.1 CDK5 regulatory subunit-associated protein 1-like [Homarus americanus]